VQHSKTDRATQETIPTHSLHARVIAIRFPKCAPTTLSVNQTPQCPNNNVN